MVVTTAGALRLLPKIERGLGTERARLGNFKGFFTERARLGTFKKISKKVMFFPKNEQIPPQKLNQKRVYFI